MGKYANVDYTNAPEYILIEFSSSEPTFDEFNLYLNELEQMYAKYEHFVLIFDATKAKYLSSELRSLQAEWIKKHTAMIQKSCIHMTYILPNVMVDIIFKCIVQFSPLPVAYTTVRTKEAAFIEAKKILSQK